MEKMTFATRIFFFVIFILTTLYFIKMEYMQWKYVETHGWINLFAKFGRNFKISVASLVIVLLIGLYLKSNKN